jgi:hypothetical protein
VAAAPNLCTPYAAPTGSTTEFDEGIDFDQAQVKGGAPAGFDGGIVSIDPRKLGRDPDKSCAPVYPWNGVRTNTIFGVIHADGGYTAWSGKPPSYSSVSGPGTGTNVDGHYSPEINSIPVSLPNVPGCHPLPDPSAATSSNSWTDSFQNIQWYDSLKVQAILNEIHHRTHNGAPPAPVPALFGMNFQAVSVDQKLVEKSTGVTGGYLGGQGTPTPALMGEIQFVDHAIGQMASALKSQDLLDSTLIVIYAKQGQSPIDPNRFFPIPGNSGASGQSPATILAASCRTQNPPTPPGASGQRKLTFRCFGWRIPARLPTL